VTESLETYYGLPAEVRFCRRCVMSNQRPASYPEFKHQKDRKAPTLHIDAHGVCDACRYAEKKEQIDWEAREAELHRLLDRFRRHDGGYDCICPGSGGKDSVYAAHLLKYQYGMHPLTVTWPPILYTDYGLANFRRWIEQGGFDNISFLAVDIGSSAFSRDIHGIPDMAAMQPTHEDLVEMERAILGLNDPGSFVEGGTARISRILQYFRGLNRDSEFPAVRCNAPWVSIVVETTGAIRGCFFQPVIGDFRNINGPAALRFRRKLNVESDPTCRRCVCSKLLGVRDFLNMKT